MLGSVPYDEKLLSGALLKDVIVEGAVDRSLRYVLNS